jgi:hypothetical protein
MSRTYISLTNGHVACSFYSIAIIRNEERKKKRKKGKGKEENGAQITSIATKISLTRGCPLIPSMVD